MRLRAKDKNCEDVSRSLGALRFVDSLGGQRCAHALKEPPDTVLLDCGEGG